MGIKPLMIEVHGLTRYPAVKSGGSWPRQFLTTRMRRAMLCRGFTFGLIATVFMAGPGRLSATPPPPTVGTDVVTAGTPARDWIVQAVANELKALQKDGSYLRYRMHIINAKGDMVRDVVESKDGTVARLILRSGRALTPEEDSAERERLQDMIDNPEAFMKHMKGDVEEKKLADNLIRLMPDAMLYSYVPGQPQIPSSSSATQVVIDYKPNPKFNAPNLEAEALSGLKGRIWIDTQTHQVVRAEGDIFQSVNLGWGVVAHIYPGGKLLLEQTNAGGGRWIYSRFMEQINVRALMVKSVHVQQDVSASDFLVLPGPMPYQDAVKLLLSTPLPTH